MMNFHLGIAFKIADEWDIKQGSIFILHRIRPWFPKWTFHLLFDEIIFKYDVP